MKKNILLLMFFAMLYACKKDVTGNSNGNGKGYVVKFTINTEARTTDPEANMRALDVLYVHVYDANKNLIRTLDSKYTAGITITDTLPAGTYTVIAVVAKKGLVYNAHTYSGDFYFNDITTYYGPNVPANFPVNFGSHDFYATKFDVTVSADMQKNLLIERTPAVINVQIKDEIPAVADSIGVDVLKENYMYFPQLASSDTAVWDQHVLKIRRKVTDSLKNSPSFSFYMMNTTRAISFHIFGLTAAGDTVSVIKMNNAVTLNQDDAITLSGNLFSTGGTFNLSSITMPPKQN